MSAHEFSGYTVGGIRKALETLGYTAKVVPALSEAAQQALEQGGVFKYHPGPTMDEVLVQVSAALGDDAVAALMEEATRASLEGIVSPLARLYLTLKKNDPSALFERFNDLLRGTTRGITASWAQESPTSGTMSLSYPQAVAPVVAHGWRGALRHVLRFAGVEGTSRVGAPSRDGKVVRVLLAWKR